VYPPEPMRALALTPLAQVRVVIVGQDPYHGPGQAEGLAFSVPAGVRHPPSLRNVFKERQRDLGLAAPISGSLVHWAARGVLLLNTTLTVEHGHAASHAKAGWQGLTDALIHAVGQRRQPTVFMAWGAHAQATIDRVLGGAPRECALVLRANHPSPLAAVRGPTPFIGCGHFSAARRWLAAQGDGSAQGLFGDAAD
jgi:uracil-DNA glycosylase